MTVKVGTITPPKVVSGVSGLANLIPGYTAGKVIRGLSKVSKVSPASNLPSWQDQYGANTSRPSYPDTSYQAFLKSGGNILGIGYNAWKDKLIQDYNTAVASYEDWYNSMSQQVNRIKEAGLNTNLAYGQASPGSAGSTSMVSPSGQTPGEVFGQGAQVLSSLFGNIKVLGEAAKIVAELPESRFKGRLAKQLDVAAAAGSMNAEFGYMQQLNSARTILGVGTSTATREAAENEHRSAYDTAEADLINIMRHTDESGEKTDDISKSMYGLGKQGQHMLSYYEYRQSKVDYEKNQKAYDLVFSDSDYWNAVKDKMIFDSIISEGQAYTAEQIITDPNMDPFSKVLALQGGLPGFLAKLSYTISSKVNGGLEGLIARWRSRRHSSNTK